MDKISEQAVKARRAYYKAWRARNREKVRRANQKYWEKRAGSLQEKGKEVDSDGK